MWEIVGGVVRYRDLVAKIKIAKYFPGVFVDDSRKFVLVKISRYTVIRAFLDIRNTMLSCLRFCCMNNRMYEIFQKREVYELIGCMNY